MKPISVGLLGIGTVGGGTWNVLARNQEEITRRAGRGIEITVVADKEIEKAQTDHRRTRARSPPTPSRWCATRTSTSSSS